MKASMPTGQVRGSDVHRDRHRRRADRSPAEARGDLRLRISCGYDMDGVALGASIACSGVCLTVVDKGAGLVRGRRLGRNPRPHRARPVGGRRAAQSRTRAEDRRRARRPHRHRPCRRHRRGGVGRAGRRFHGGHDRRRARTSRPISRAKGSVCIDGVSLTVNEVEPLADGVRFGINLIPHTAQHTTLGDLQRGPRGQHRDRPDRPLSGANAGQPRDNVLM